MKLFILLVVLLCCIALSQAAEVNANSNTGNVDFINRMNAMKAVRDRLNAHFLKEKEAIRIRMQEATKSMEEFEYQRKQRHETLMAKLDILHQNVTSQFHLIHQQLDDHRQQFRLIHQQLDLANNHLDSITAEVRRNSEGLHNVKEQTNNLTARFDSLDSKITHMAADIKRTTADVHAIREFFEHGGDPFKRRRSPTDPILQSFAAKCRSMAKEEEIRSKGPFTISAEDMITGQNNTRHLSDNPFQRSP